ncbi:uncharacterized protein [Blastocystis hominis]|uniref:SKP1 component POZ domain-containing protein n=1 Tax=Blastocystis hominis TaxID=12968 RepID=D8M2W8_BLAHO|nr:uncharacterized protein [Blastocystis hominis]CBK22691.2 unnamed protein product [Blastocystis hominis]|eukprot:XP_012896739.1 uncharacterized protein [Blastocystis hominis]
MQPQEGVETIKIISSDNKEFVVEKKIAFMSELIKHLYDVSPETSREIVVPDVSGDILGRVILFCSHHCDNPMPEIEKPLKSNKMEENVDKWDADFIDLEDSVLYQIVTASNYLMIQSLLDLAYP